jgi:hypothetical protein
MSLSGKEGQVGRERGRKRRKEGGEKSEGGEISIDEALCGLRSLFVRHFT